MLDDGELRTVDLGAATGIRFTDAKLQEQFKDYLAALAAARSKDKRSVYIDSTDASEREVVASYMIPAAVWKSSYRLIFGASGAAHAGRLGHRGQHHRRGLDQGAALAGFRAGRFRSSASSTRRSTWSGPAAELADDAAARPVVHEGSVQRRGLRRRHWLWTGRRSRSGSWRQRLCRRQYGGFSGARCPPIQRRQLRWQKRCGSSRSDRFERAVAPSTIVASASAGELGELFEYRIAQPVTIRKRRIRHAAVPAAAHRRPQAADLLRPQLAASHQRRRADQHQRQDARWRPHHGLRRRRLRRRSPHGDPQGRRQAAHQLRRGPGHAHHRGLRQQGRAWCARSTPTAASSPPKWPPKRPAPTPSATWIRRPRP